MKIKYLSIILLLLAGCTTDKNKSDAYGNFEADEVVVSAEATGKILKLDISEGIEIKKGEVIGIIDSTTLSLKKQQLVARKVAISSKLTNIAAQIKVQEQQKKNLLVEKKRVENLLKDGAATRKQLDDINGQLDLLDSQTESIKTQKVSVQSEMEVVNTQTRELEYNIEKCLIISPIDGTVLSKFAEAGEITSFGKPLFKIANLDRMILRVYVSGTQVAGIKTGQTAEILIDKPEGGFDKLEGKVSWIYEKAEFTPKIIQTREERINLVYAVKIRVENDGRLKI
ncbi:MAG: efflux RND transporter periplasmic adaptor subunit, partial [Desulfobacula sp.]|nr:efflux RND transporter periplasmic adaptor subunit [Desulfobacula sp.]